MTMNLLPSQATDVAKVAAALRSLGVGKGDVVCGFMPNAYETIVSALGTAAIGAAWSSASLDFGPGGVLDRFKQVKPKVIFTVNATTYKRKLFDLRRKVDEIVSELPTLEKVILINYKSALPVNLSDYKCKEKLAMYEDFVANFSGAKPSYERVPFGHPLFVMFSSGTTGVPKAMVHTVGGTLLKHLEEHLIQNDARQQDSMFFYTTCGWMMWNWSISFLAFGSRLILYDESPLEPDHYVIPKIISDSKATIIGMGAQLYDRFEKIDAKRNLCKEFGLGAVRLVLSTGSPLKEAIFRYINAKLAPGAVIGSISGGTDIIGCFMGATLSKSVIPGQCTVPYLGHEIKSFNPRGEAIQDQQGELVCLTPFPSMPSHFLNDTDGSRYSKAYFERFPGVWAHGDYCIIDSATGGITMLGRSDATLNRGGVRMGTAEIYNVVDTFAEIADSIVVGRQIPQEKDEEILLFVKLSPGSVLDDHLRLAICKTIRERQSPRHVPNKIIPIADIPYTNSGKKVEIAVKQIVNDLQRRQQELERLEAARRERMSNMGPPSINMGRGGPPPHMVPPPFQSQQQPNPFSGGPPGPFGVPSLAVPPPTHHHQQQHPQHQQQQFAPPPQQGNPNGPRPNVIEGVQRLLQLFKNDDGRGAGPGNQQNMQQNHPGGAFNNYQPRYGASGDHYGGGSDAFGNQPPMKRERR
ncbi:unnamed protein product, partial [Mesorhabditis spiculigera]